ncbi:redoxin family protein [Croceicoccus mobilis]|uniref:Thiol:disulfide interchange protein n=1 Tax=Croceicoccus mobilis TaxID=1703339 RepID=A0A916Z4A0_9SPHN|nr:redoxin family protein [Croceicoccus mobilis]GGD72965.1 thiol:disulfide interchange protein [Croceicoccus mobilis]
MSAPDTAKRPSRWAIWLPLGLFALLCALVAWGLANPGSTEVESRMIGQPLPAIELPQAVEENPGVTLAGARESGPRLLNIWASWCVPCIVEAPVLEELKARGVAIDGVAIRDKSEDIEMFLQRNGNPYRGIARDDVSAVQMAIGSSGVPETFVIDADGIIRYQHIGPIMERDIAQIMARLKDAEEPA